MITSESVAKLRALAEHSDLQDLGRIFGTPVSDLIQDLCKDWVSLTGIADKAGKLTLKVVELCEQHDALKAEVERLKDVADKATELTVVFSGRIVELGKERDALKREVDHLPRANKQRLHRKATQLRAERDALKHKVEVSKRKARCHDALLTLGPEAIHKSYCANCGWGRTWHDG